LPGQVLAYDNFCDAIFHRARVNKSPNCLPIQRGVRWQTAIAPVGNAALISLPTSVAAASILVMLGLVQ
jgi:hypothetical protein